MVCELCLLLGVGFKGCSGKFGTEAGIRALHTRECCGCECVEWQIGRHDSLCIDAGYC